MTNTTNTATDRIRLIVVKEYRIGHNDDEGIAATIGDLIECECCGKKIARVNKLSNGGRVGSECATYLTRPDLRETDEKVTFYFGRRSKKADTYLVAVNAI